ncbi:MAG: NAD kinase [Bacteroidetes bacterium]|nr:MAG: NAD kinase [Bacteroidota bacterium]
MKVAIYGHAFNPKLPAGQKAQADSSAEALLTLLWKLEKSGVEALLHKSLVKQLGRKAKVKDVFSKYEDIKGKVKFLFSIGGDGTFLETVTLVRDSEIPVVGINTGRLGFLSCISKEEIEPAVDSLLKGKYSLDKRTLLELNMKGSYFGGCKYALNEIAVQKTDSSSMITIHVSLNSKFLNSYWADGLIVATPTGSTAYSLSCGGPIVMPDSDNFVITPIAPHNLNIRPVIISSHDTVTLEVEGRSPNFLVSLDSRSENIKAPVKLSIKKAGFLFSLVSLEKQDFLLKLRSKLNWGLDKRN